MSIIRIENGLTNTSEAITENKSPAEFDAFGRQRVSSPYTLGDYKHVYGEETEMLTSMSSGNGTSKILKQAEASVRLSVGTGINEYIIHQSRMYHHYMPGKSQLAFSSFCFGLPVSGTNKRIGIFDNLNGIYFQQSGDGTLQFVIRSATGVGVSERIIPQSQWSINKLNAENGSVFNLDITKTQLFVTDYQWLGVGRVRCGFVHDGSIVYAHEFYNSNNYSAVYISNPNLPIRCELRNYARSLSGSMDQICSTVISEGGYSEAGMDFAVRNSGLRTLGASSTLPSLSIRLATGYKGVPNRSIVRLNKASFCSLDHNAFYEIWRFPSSSNIIGGTWSSVSADSVVEYNTNATGINFTSGNMIEAGFLPAGGQGANNFLTSSSDNRVSDARQGYIGQNIESNDSNLFTVVFKNSTATSTQTFSSLQWRETR